MVVRGSDVSVEVGDVGVRPTHDVTKPANVIRHPPLLLNISTDNSNAKQITKKDLRSIVSFVYITRTQIEQHDTHVFML